LGRRGNEMLGSKEPFKVRSFIAAIAQHWTRATNA
jgi:hypothetical protein